VKVTQVNADGKLENIRAPYYGTPKAKAFWQPVFDGIRERLAKRGWQNTTVLLGVPWDAPPQDEVIDFLKEVAPGWRWRVFSHGYTIPLPKADGKLIWGGGLEVGWLEFIGMPNPAWGGEGGRYVTMLRGAGMKRTYPETTCIRGYYQYRDLPTLCMLGGFQGYSQLGLDYWFSLAFSTGLGGNPRDGLIESITKPGPNGAEPCIDYDLLREGLQAAAAYFQVRDHDPNVPAEVKTKAIDAAQTFAATIFGRVVYGDQAARNQNRWNAAVRDLYQVAGELQAVTPRK
jgi:hypothetical protein